MTKQIDPILLNGYAAFHKQTGEQIGDVAETTSIVKSRFTRQAGWGYGYKHPDIIKDKKFDHQPMFQVHRLINPVIMEQFLQDLSGQGITGDEVITAIRERIGGSCIK